MRQAILFFMALSLSVVFTANTVGKEYPLVFKTIPPGEAESFPGVYGLYAQVKMGDLALAKEVKKEPEATSQHPLYGKFEGGETAPVFLFRLDESKDGQGYDRLILDLNQNHDLTDDPVISPAPEDQPPPARPEGRDQALFGPIVMPEDKKIGPNRPVYFSEMMLYNLRMITNNSSRGRSRYIGYMRLKAGCYWEAAVDVKGTRHTLSLIDANCDLRIGEPWKPTIYENDSEKSWYFQPGDSFLIDADGSGQYEEDPFNSEYCSFGSLVYLGGVACQVALAKDCQSIQVEPWTDPMAQVKIQPAGKLVRRVALARETGEDKWQLVFPPVTKGRVSVPPGKYRLYGCTLQGKGFWRKPIMASAYQRSVKEPFAFKAGQDNRIVCGSPLNIKVTADKGPPEPWEVPNGEKVDREKDLMLRINAEVAGKGGEIYSGYGEGKDYSDDPPKPTYVILDERGKTLAKGNLEFG